ncbi:MAG: hypothetical protein HQL69_21880 [Magnetococcales bacterium]|nr:hypothetical protein [Magnetococcales bacterium]
MDDKDEIAAKRARFALVDVRGLRMQIIADSFAHCAVRTLHNYLSKSLPEDVARKIANNLKIDPAWFYLPEEKFDPERFKEAIEIGRTSKSSTLASQDPIENLKDLLKQERLVLAKESATGLVQVPYFDEKFFTLFQNHKIIKTFSDLAKVLGIGSSAPHMWRESTQASNALNEINYIPASEFYLICTLFDIKEQHLKASEINDFHNGILHVGMGIDRNIKKWQKLVDPAEESEEIVIRQHMSQNEVAQNVFLQTRGMVLVSDEQKGFATVQADTKIKLEIACPINWSGMVLLHDERNEWFQISPVITASEASIHNGSIIIPQRGSLGVSSPGPNQFVVVQSKQPFPESINNTSLPVDSLLRELTSFIAGIEDEEKRILKKSIFVEPCKIQTS